MPVGVRLGKLCLVVVVVLAATVPPLKAKSAPDPDGFDVVGDSSIAPDIERVQHSVHREGTLRRVVIGVSLSRSDLNEGEQVDVFFDWGAGGKKPFGSDGRFVLIGHALPTPDAYASYVWKGRWVAVDFSRPSVTARADGRLDFGVDFEPGVTEPGDLVMLGVRVSSTATGMEQGPAIDYAPDLTLSNLSFSLMAPVRRVGRRGDKKCVRSPRCSPRSRRRAGKCSRVTPGCGVPGRDGVNPNPPEPNPTVACVHARVELRSANQRLTLARRALRRASSQATKRKQLRRVRRLRGIRSKWKRLERSECR